MPESHAYAPARRWPLVAALAASACATVLLAVWPSEEQALVEAVNGHSGSVGYLTGSFDHLVPEDLPRPCVGLDRAVDHSATIPGDETVSTACD